jgi:hypothetical protein
MEHPEDDLLQMLVLHIFYVDAVLDQKVKALHLALVGSEALLAPVVLPLGPPQHHENRCKANEYGEPGEQWFLANFCG